MISRVAIKNFQGHVDSRLDLAPGINVITGRSDSGKSSIIRALRWVIENRPAKAGEAFKHHEASKGDAVSVELVVAGPGVPHVITRFRKGAENGYAVDGEKLVAIRSDVPDEVAQVLHVAPHNLQTQHDPYFLVGDPPSEVARRLNQVCGLNIIDSCLSAANSMLSRNSDDVQQCQSRVASAQEFVDSFDTLDSREQALTALEQQALGCEQLRAFVHELPPLLEQMGKGQQLIAAYDEFLAVAPQVLALHQSAQSFQELSYVVGDLILLVKSLEQCEHDLAQYQGMDETFEVVQQLQSSASKAPELRRQVQELQKLIEESTHQDKEIRAKDALIVDMESQFHSLLEAGGVCPLCQREVGRGDR